MMEIESWLPIPGYEGRYCVSDHGNVMSMSYMGTQTGPTKKRFTVHRLVALAFIGPRPDGHHINHIDGDKANNALLNLEYVTPSENQKHSFRVGLQCNKGTQHSQAKLNDEKVRDIRERHSLGESKHSLASEYGVSYATIHYVITRQRWPHVASCEKAG